MAHIRRMIQGYLPQAAQAQAHLAKHEAD